MGKAGTPPDKFAHGWLDKLDGRYATAQQMRERYQAFSDDLGGNASLSYMQRSLVERALWLEYWLSQQEQQLATGGEFEVGKWTQAANSLQGILSKLGLQRIARDVPTLNEYLSKRREAAG
jgi:hypothetical protein